MLKEKIEVPGLFKFTLEKLVFKGLLGFLFFLGFFVWASSMFDRNCCRAAYVFSSSLNTMVHSNDLFEAPSDDGQTKLVLQQVRGLHIGGHLSAQPNVADAGNGIY